MCRFVCTRNPVEQPVQICRTSGVCDVSQQLHAFFIKTDQWTPGIVGFLVQLQNVLHLPNELWRDFWNTPASYLPRFEFVFFSSSRTVSGER